MSQPRAPGWQRQYKAQYAALRTTTMSSYNFTSTLQGLKAAMQENAGWALGNKEMQESGSASRTKDGDEITSQAHGYYTSVKTALENGLSYAGSSLSTKPAPKEEEADKTES